MNINDLIEFCSDALVDEIKIGNANSGRYRRGSGKRDEGNERIVGGDIVGLCDKSEAELEAIEEGMRKTYNDVFFPKITLDDLKVGGKYSAIFRLEGDEDLQGVVNGDMPLKAKKEWLSTNERDIRAMVNKYSSQEKIYDKLKDNADFKQYVSTIPVEGSGKSNEGHTKDVIRSLVRDWSMSSGDTRPKSVSMQVAAKDLFGGDVNHLMVNFDPSSLPDGTSPSGVRRCKANQLELGLEMGDIKMKAKKAFLMAQYDETQSYLKENGIKELIVYRGQQGVHSKLDHGANIDLSMQPLSSFSADSGVAGQFAWSSNSPTQKRPAIIAAVVPANRILSLPNTGLGCTMEREVVIVGGKARATVISDPDDVRRVCAAPNPSARLIRRLYESKSLSKTAIVNIDSELHNADWVKMSWDLPKINSPAFKDMLKDNKMTLMEFMKLPAYTLRNVKQTKSIGLDNILKIGNANSGRYRRGSGKQDEDQDQDQPSRGDAVSLCDKSEEELKSIEVALENAYKEIYYPKFDVADFAFDGKYRGLTEELGNANLAGVIDGAMPLKDKKKFLEINSHDLTARVNKFTSQAKIYSKLERSEDFQKYIQKINYRGTNSEFAKQTIRSLINDWALSSGDSGARQVSMQMVAKELFGGRVDHLLKNFDISRIPESEIGLRNKVKSGARELAKEMQEVNVKAKKAFLMAQYDETQSYLKEKGITELVVYRGQHGVKSKLENGAKIDLDMQPMSSFTMNPNIAKRFANSSSSPNPKIQVHPSIIATVVPASRILSMPNTGYGCSEEAEVVVVGGKASATVISDVENIRRVFATQPTARFIRRIYMQKSASKSGIVNIDEELHNADWVKASWDLPKMNSPEFKEMLKNNNMTLMDFMKLPAYTLRNVKQTKSIGLENILKIGNSNSGRYRRGSKKERPLSAHEAELAMMMDQYVKMMSDHGKPEGYKYGNSYELVRKNGQFYEPSPLPSDVRAGKAKACFMNAGRLAMDNPSKYTYVEGFATPSNIPIPMAHAWCIDNTTKKVVDPTWSDKKGMPGGTAYLGIAFTDSYLRSTILKTKIWGIIPDYPRGDHNPWKDGFPDTAFKKTAIDEKINYEVIMDKEKDRDNYHYIEDYLIGGYLKSLATILKIGTATSGRYPRGSGKDKPAVSPRIPKVTYFGFVAGDKEENARKKEARATIEEELNYLHEKFPKLQPYTGTIKELVLVDGWDMREGGKKCCDKIEEFPSDVVGVNGLYKRWNDPSYSGKNLVAISLVDDPLGFSDKWSEHKELALGEHNVSRTPRDTFRHEFGHHYIYAQMKNPTGSAFIQDFNHEISKFPQRELPVAIHSVSMYGLKNGHEALCEMLCAYTHRGYKRGSLPPIFEGLMDRHIGNFPVMVIPTKALLDMFMKGNARSGNHGHGGRPGKVGGSTSRGRMGAGSEDRDSDKPVDISGYSSDHKEISKDQAMAQAEYSDIKGQMDKDLSEISSGIVAQVAVKGDLTTEAATNISRNMKSALAAHASYLAGDTMGVARDYIDSFNASVKKGMDDGSLKGIKAEDLNAMAVDNIRKLLYQEVESNRQQFTDHGIRHIVGNTIRSKEIMNTMGTPTGKQELMGDFIMTNHDVGYTTPLIRAGGLRGVMMAGQHPSFSEKIAGQQRSMFNEGKVFSGDEYDKILSTIATHDATKMDKDDLIATPTRISDNLSLFSTEKLPGMFRYVKNGDRDLIIMGMAASKNDKVSFEVIKTKLYHKIDESNLSPQLKRDLKAATKEISYVTPKFTLGVLAGEISKITKSSTGGVQVDIKYNSYDAFLQRYFDMGQKQTKKFLGDYGHTDFTKTEYKVGGDLLHLRVIGSGQKDIGLSTVFKKILREFSDRGDDLDLETKTYLQSEVDHCI